MIPESAVYLVSSGAYAVVFAVLLLWLLRVEGTSRLVCGLVAGVVGVAALTNLITGFGMGSLAVAGGVVNAPILVNDLVAYSGYFVLTAVLARAPRKLLVTVGAITVAQRVAFELAYGGYVEGVSVLGAAGVVVVGWFVLLYLFIYPVWSAAQDVPARQRLLHWKCRNLLMFMIGMLIVFAMLILAGVFDTFVLTLTNVYVSFLIRVGLAGFIFVNVDEIAGGTFRASIGRGNASGVIGLSND